MQGYHSQGCSWPTGGRRLVMGMHLVDGNVPADSAITHLEQFSLNRQVPAPCSPSPYHLRFLSAERPLHARPPSWNTSENS
jgi:hypothetical protein